MVTTRTGHAKESTEHDAFRASCPARGVLVAVTSTWSILVVAALRDGARRHGQLRLEVGGISQKMLTQTLRTLERDGLITRTLTPSVPLRVDYELTELGRGLLPILEAAKSWSEANVTRVLASRDVELARDIANPQ